MISFSLDLGRKSDCCGSGIDHLGGYSTGDYHHFVEEVSNYTNFTSSIICTVNGIIIDG